MSIALIESHSVFVLFFLPYPFIGPAPSPPSSSSPSHFSSTHCDEQPVKVKRKKSFNLSRKFPFYKSKENIVVDLVDSERKYQPCDPQCAAGGEEGRGETGLHPFSVHAFFTFSLSNFHLLAPPTPPRDDSSFSYHPTSLTLSQREEIVEALSCVRVRVCLSICLWAVRGVSSCVHVACILCCINTNARYKTKQKKKTRPVQVTISSSSPSAPSLTHNGKNLINWTPFKLNRSKSHFNGIGLV